VGDGDGGGEEKYTVMVVTFSSSSLEEESLVDPMSVSQSPMMYAFPPFCVISFAYHLFS
jgi:hypothetical protein